MDALLNIRGLRSYFYRKGDVLRAVVDVDLKICPGETVALVGESGCGKSTLALSIVRLLPHSGRIVSGTIGFRGQNILGMSERELRRVRGKEISLIFQDQSSALNPVMKVGEQIAECIRCHMGLDRATGKRRAMDLIGRMYLPNPEKVYACYPHELSGGQRQRILIAIALACRPTLVVADEPTSSLDVSIQGQILILLKELKEEYQLALLLITHDFGIVSYLADRVAVMYAGRIVEEAPTRALLGHPLHPYTKSLLGAIPRIAFQETGSAPEIVPLTGMVPDLAALPRGCAFHPRCPVQMEECTHHTPAVTAVGKNHRASCLRLGELAETLSAGQTLRDN